MVELTISFYKTLFIHDLEDKPYKIKRGVFMNNVTLIGRLTADPELRYIPGDGTAVAKFTLAVDRELSREKKQELEQQGKPTADFIRIITWRGQAESCANYLSKGQQAAVEGRITTGSYTNNDGRKVYTTEVLANRVEFLNGPSQSQDKNKEPEDEWPEGFGPVDDDDLPF